MCDEHRDSAIRKSQGSMLGVAFLTIAVIVY